MDLLNDMALFVEVARAMSFRRAAEALGMPNSTLSRRVSALEKAIGLRLMHRTTRRLELTEAGQLYYERCKRIVEEARLAHEQLGELLAQPSGVLRASLPVDFANSTLAPLIAEFARRHPGIRFEFDLTPRRVDLVSEPFDVAIRMGASQDSTLVARLLATLDTHLYASPAYVSRVGPPRQPADLARHEGLLFKAGGGGPPGACRARTAAPRRWRSRSVAASSSTAWACCGAWPCRTWAWRCWPMWWSRTTWPPAGCNACCRTGRGRQYRSMR